MYKDRTLARRAQSFDKEGDASSQQFLTLEIRLLGRVAIFSMDQQMRRGGRQGL